MLSRQSSIFGTAITQEQKQIETSGVLSSVRNNYYMRCAVFGVNLLRVRPRKSAKQKYLYKFLSNLNFSPLNKFKSYSN